METPVGDFSDYIGRRTVNCDRRDIDRYGRFVAVCHAAGLHLGVWLVGSGVALALRRYSTDCVAGE